MAIFKISTPNINGKHFSIKWDEESEKGLLSFDVNTNDPYSLINEIILNKNDFYQICEICGCKDWHIENLLGFDFTPNYQQRDQIWSYIDDHQQTARQLK